MRCVPHCSINPVRGVRAAFLLIVFAHANTQFAPCDIITDIFVWQDLVNIILQAVPQHHSPVASCIRSSAPFTIFFLSRPTRLSRRLHFQIAAAGHDQCRRYGEGGGLWARHNRRREGTPSKSGPVTAAPSKSGPVRTAAVTACPESALGLLRVTEKGHIMSVRALSTG